jgi:hypothetical protein
MIARGVIPVAAAMLVCLAVPSARAAMTNAVPLAGEGFAPSQLVLENLLGYGITTPPVLAQRVIDREWGQSEDSIYVVKDLPGWKSETGALLMSAALPGAGQAYNDDRHRGMWFALAEAAGWTARIMLHQSGEKVREDAARFAGVPADSGSTWSIARWVRATSASPSDLQELYAADPEAFYDRIASDPGLLSGWAGDPEASRTHFAELRATSDRRLHGARWSESILWVNHVTAAVDAFRAARFHNVRLGPALGFKVKSGWRHGRPEWRAALERKF